MKNKIFLTSVLAMIVACPAVSAPTNGYIQPGDTSADCTSPDPLAYDGREYDYGYYTLRADWAEDECFIRLDPDMGVSEANPDLLYTRFDDGAYLRKNGNTLLERMYPKDDLTYPDGKNGLYEVPRGPTVSVIWDTSRAVPTNNSTGTAYTVAAVADTSGERPFSGFWSETSGRGTQYIYDDGVTIPYVLTESGAQRAASIAKDANGECPDEIWYAGYGCASDIPMPSTEPSLSGYNFEGWYTNPRSGTRIDSVPCLYLLHQTYYARWSPKNYEVTYSCPSQVDGVSYNITLIPPSGRPNPETVTFNSSYTMWNSTTACVGDGVECSGWVCTRTDGGAFSEPSTTGGYWQNASNVSCVAVCGSNKVNLIWDYNDNVSEDEQTYCQYGTTGTINVPQPTRHGYTFNGWTVVYWSDDGSSSSGVNNQPINIGGNGSGGDRIE